MGIITRLGPYTDSEHISLGLTDTLICIEMPFFATAHMYAFSYHDFTKPAPTPTSRAPAHVARMTLGYALRDALGLKDLVEDTRATLRGQGINYRAFEPSEGGIHIGAARDRRIRAGLRYAAGGKRKYWLPDVRGPEGDGDVTAPLFAADADSMVHDASDIQSWRGGDDVDGEEDEYALTFSDVLAGPAGVDEVLYKDAKKYVFGDYLYPVVDVSSEEVRRAMWEEEERVVRDIATSGFGRTEAFSGYGATQSGKRTHQDDRDQDGARPPLLFARTPCTPSPPRSRKTSDCPPIASGSRTPSHQSHPHSPAQGASRPHLPRLLSSLSLSVSGAASTSHSPRVASKRAPLIKEDAVDLVVPADTLQVPSTSRGPHSPRSPVLIRVWDEVDPGASPTMVEVNDDERDRQGYASNVESDVRFVIRVDDDFQGDDETEAEAEAEIDGRTVVEESGVVRDLGDSDVVREQTPPPHARGHGFGFGAPEEEESEDSHNPWA